MVSTIASKDGRLLPGAARILSKAEQQVWNRRMKEYYSGKIKQLETGSLPIFLLKGLCSDTPFDPGELHDGKSVKRFAMRCKKYYEEKIAEIEKSECQRHFLARWLEWFLD